MIKELSHVGLSVSNIDESLAFYRDYLGMEVIMELDIQDDRIGRVVGIPGAKCRIIHLRLGEATLELFEYSEPSGKNVTKDLRQCDLGISHIGFEVNHIHKHLKEIQDRGCKMLGEPVEF